MSNYPTKIKVDMVKIRKRLAENKKSFVYELVALFKNG